LKSGKYDEKITNLIFNKIHKIFKLW
jgi:hypothetical protein